MESVIDRERNHNPPRAFPPVSSKDGTHINYVESQPLPIGDDDYLSNLSEVKVRIADFGVCQCFPLIFVAGE